MNLRLFAVKVTRAFWPVFGVCVCVGMCAALNTSFNLQQTRSMRSGSLIIITFSLNANKSSCHCLNLFIQCNDNSALTTVSKRRARAFEFVCCGLHFIYYSNANKTDLPPFHFDIKMSCRNSAYLIYYNIFDFYHICICELRNERSTHTHTHHLNIF